MELSHDPVSKTPSEVFSKNPNITFHVVTEPLRRAALECECKSFGTIDFFFNKFHGVDDKVHMEIFESILSTPDNDLMSTCAVDNTTKKVVCGMRNEPYPPGGVHIYPTMPDGSMHPYVRFLGTLDAQWPILFSKIGLTPNESEFLYFFMGYTDPQLFNHGIYTELYQFTEVYARKRGFKHIFGLLMSKPMQGTMTRKFGYQNLREIGYDELELDGQFPMKQYLVDHPEYQSETIMFAYKAI